MGSIMRAMPGRVNLGRVTSVRDPLAPLGVVGGGG